MKNSLSEIKSKIMQKYNSDNESLYGSKSTNINVLLNRVKLDKKKENQKKILFSAATSLGVILFGILIF